VRVASRDFVYVRELLAHVGERVVLQGWVAGKRSSGKVRFLVLRDGSGWLQCVAFVKDVSPEVFERMDPHPPGVVRAPGRHGAQGRAGARRVRAFASRPRVLHEAAEYPVQPKEHGVEFLFDHRHLYLRSRTPHAVLRVRNEVLQACRDFFYARDFVLIDSPILTPAACEGTSTLVRDRLLRRQGLPLPVGASSTWSPRPWPSGASTAWAPPSGRRRARRAGTSPSSG
jgi:asparaginyl-tRNA synthetase